MPSPIHPGGGCCPAGSSILLGGRSRIVELPLDLSALSFEASFRLFLSASRMSTRSLH